MNNEIVHRLRTPKPGGQAPSPLELEAAGVIESLEFQLKARIERSPICSPSEIASA